MTKGDIKKVLNCPCKPLLLLALELVNLKDKERNAIDLVDIRGITEQEASEEMKCSIRSIQYYRKNAYEKFSKAWNNKPLINKIINMRD